MPIVPFDMLFNSLKQAEIFETWQRRYGDWLAPVITCLVLKGVASHFQHGYSITLVIFVANKEIKSIALKKRWTDIECICMYIMQV